MTAVLCALWSDSEGFPLMQDSWKLISCDLKQALVWLCERRPDGSPFPTGRTLPGGSTDARKYANHNNIAIEPQLILCYEDFKGRHWPDIHNEGINEKEKCKDSKKNKINWLGENLDTLFFVLHVCWFVFFFFFLQNGLWSFCNYYYFFNPNLGIYGGAFSNLFANWKRLFAVDHRYWQRKPSPEQVGGSDTESDVTLKVTCVGGFSEDVAVAAAGTQTEAPGNFILPDMMRRKTPGVCTILCAAHVAEPSFVITVNG